MRLEQEIRSEQEKSEI